MKKYRINVNGNTYEVEVEEIGGASAPVIKPTISVAAPVITPVSSPAPAATPKANAPTPAGAEVISAPMPGKIVSIKVQAGQSVKAGDLILTLEAMKMENEIFCGEAGTIKEVRCSEGAAVNPGDVLVVIG